MTLMQTVRIASSNGPTLDVIMRQDSINKPFAVDMSCFAFPNGTTFTTAEEALVAGMKAIRNTFGPKERFSSAQSIDGEAFLDNKTIQRIMADMNADIGQCENVKKT